MFRAADKTQELAEHNWWHRTPAESSAAMIVAESAVAGVRAARIGQLPVAVARARDVELRRGDVRARGDRPAVHGASRRDRCRWTEAHDHRGRQRARRHFTARRWSARAGRRAARRRPELRSHRRSPPIRRRRAGRQVRDRLVRRRHRLHRPRRRSRIPTSTRQRVAALVQIPRGSIAVAVRSRPRRSTCCSNRTVPTATSTRSTSRCRVASPTSRCTSAGSIASSPRHRRTVIEVTAGGAVADPTSWAYLSQHGTLADVVAYLASREHRRDRHLEGPVAAAPARWRS